MQTLYRASRYILPVLFLGYATYANVTLLRSDKVTLAGKTDLLRGQVTAQIDRIYKSALPHRDGAVGLVGAARYMLLGEGRAGVLTGQDGWLFTAEEARAMSQTMAIEVARISGVRDRLTAAGATLVIVPVPAKADIQAEEAGRPALTAELVARYDSFRRALSTAGIASVHTRPALSGVLADHRAFFATDTHWTAEGARAVAQAVADDLLASGRVTVGAAFLATPEPAQHFSGDLVSFVTSDDLAPSVGLAPETVVPYLATPATATDLSAGDLFAGTEAGGIVLVGTSYSANPRWSFAEALKIALRADVVNVAQEGQGPVRPMLDYLASDEFAASPPAVVIWEFPVRYLSDPSIWEPETAPEAGENAT